MRCSMPHERTPGASSCARGRKTARSLLTAAARPSATHSSGYRFERGQSLLLSRFASRVCLVFPLTRFRSSPFRRAASLFPSESIEWVTLECVASPVSLLVPLLCPSSVLSWSACRVAAGSTSLRLSSPLVLSSRRGTICTEPRSSCGRERWSRCATESRIALSSSPCAHAVSVAWSITSCTRGAMRERGMRRPIALQLTNGATHEDQQST